jgi:hypothetical protein
MVVFILAILYVRKNGEKGSCFYLHIAAMREISMKEESVDGESTRLIEIAVTKEIG